MTVPAPTDLPRVGMLATVRNRRGIVVSVEPFLARPDPQLHLVRIEYTDADGSSEDTLIWERERQRVLLEPTALPRVADEPPMVAADFDALVRATRWSALTPFVSADGSGASSELPIASPFFGAVQVEDFQLVPLLKALQMPRVSLLLADDVGLGKTVEAGLVLAELLLRRRIRRVLVLTPASLKQQWRQEMWDKFALTFDLVDRDETHALQTRLGLDANPWRTFQRIIASYYYLRQPDVLEQFLATCRTHSAETAYQLPWDLLIVDEAHNLTPSNFGADSELSKTLRLISPYFEHKLFLTATPHNGHTRCFSGLLEQLDPVRFTQRSELTPAEHARIDDVLVRRLKREINQLDDERGRPRRFAERFPEPLPLFFGKKERALAAAFAALRAALKSAVAKARGAERLAGNFAIEVLNKRLLSCPYTFAESWFRLRQGMAEDEAADAAEVTAARRAAEEELDDDREREGRALHAARTVGAWLKPLAGRLQSELSAVDAVLDALGLVPSSDGVTDPVEDARLERIGLLLDQKLRRGKKWVDDERLIVFTEYKTTLDYLERRLLAKFEDNKSAIRVLYGGGMDLRDREKIRKAFNDPDDPVRVLLATDAAAEGLNLQETARLLVHFDVPWNPARLEQRNGRLDRHGQARDVSVYHFTSEDDADLAFLGRVVDKVEAIREDLGSVGEVFDAAFQRRFQDLEDAASVSKALDAGIESRRERSRLPRQEVDRETPRRLEQVRELCRHIDLSPRTLCDTLESALGIGMGHPRLEGPDARGRMKLSPQLPPRWVPLIDETVRLPAFDSAQGPLPGLVFDAQHFIKDVGGRPVFRPSPDTLLLHLGHPMFRQALATFARLRFPGEKTSVTPSRWTVRSGQVPAGADALLLVTLEELGVNELREAFHHWVRTLRIPIVNGALAPALNYVPPRDDAANERADTDRLVVDAQRLWEEVEHDLPQVLSRYALDLTQAISELLATKGKSALAEEKKRYDGRVKEVEAAMAANTLNKLEKERDKLLDEHRQLQMFETERREIEQRLADLDDELARRRTHYEELLAFLRRDQERVLRYMLPKRFQLRGAVQVFPVAIELRFPMGSNCR